MTEVATSDAVTRASDAVVDVSDLAELYRVRAAQRVPQRAHDLSRSSGRYAVRLRGACSTISCLRSSRSWWLPQPMTSARRLPRTPRRGRTPELRVIEPVERCKAVLDAVALEALARLEADIEATERDRFARLGRESPPGWVSADTLTVLEVSTATGIGQQEIQSRLQLLTARSEGAADLRARLRRGAVSVYRACTLQSEISAVPAQFAPSIIESTLRPKDDAPPSPALFRQRLTRSCLAADREAALRRRRARRQRGAHARIDADGLGVLTVVTDAAKVIAAMERADTPWPAQPVRPATRAAWTRCAPTSSQTHSCSAAPTCRSAHVGASRVHSPRSRAP